MSNWGKDDGGGNSRGVTNPLPPPKAAKKIIIDERRSWEKMERVLDIMATNFKLSLQ